MNKNATDYSQLIVFKGVHELTTFGSQIKNSHRFTLKKATDYLHLCL